MMSTKKNKIEKVSKPFMRGTLFDRSTLPRAIKFFLGTAVMAFIFLIICAMMSLGSQWLTVLLNAMILLATYLLFNQMGVSAGADAVNQGEIMLAREEKGRPVAEWERRGCYHPLKGFVSALIGSVPLLICSMLLAAIAQRQNTGLGTLPTWVSSLSSRPEIGNPLMYYQEVTGMTLEAAMRLVVRMSVMPFVNIVGAQNADRMLLLERISPLLNLLPALAYGFGYMGGTSVRTQVHTNIALGKKKAKRKQAKERRARQKRGPEQLN